jgi:hypothetical protein
MHHTQSPLRGEQSDFFKNTFEESCDIVTQHATSF